MHRTLTLTCVRLCVPSFVKLFSLVLLFSSLSLFHNCLSVSPRCRSFPFILSLIAAVESSYIWLVTRRGGKGGGGDPLFYLIALLLYVFVFSFCLSLSLEFHSQRSFATTTTTAHASAKQAATTTTLSNFSKLSEGDYLGGKKCQSLNVVINR